MMASLPTGTGGSCWAAGSGSGPGRSAAVGDGEPGPARYCGDGRSAVMSVGGSAVGWNGRPGGPFAVKGSTAGGVSRSGPGRSAGASGGAILVVTSAALVRMDVIVVVALVVAAINVVLLAVVDMENLYYKRTSMYEHL
jgi:hypothetical protein